MLFFLVILSQLVFLRMMVESVVSKCLLQNLSKLIKDLVTISRRKKIKTNSYSAIFELSLGKLDSLQRSNSHSAKWLEKNPKLLSK